MEPKIVQAVGIGRKINSTGIRAGVRNWLMRQGAVALLKLPIGPARCWSLTMRWYLFVSWVMNAPVSGASKGDTFENDLLKLIFNATAIANIADNASASPLTNLQVALHTSSPGDSGNQTTNEIAYTSYARVAVARTTGGWTVTSNSVSPVATIGFPAGTGGTGTATHFSIGTASSGTGKILYHGTVTPNIVCGNGITPELTTATAVTED